tara:strand:+ start:1476 stop:2372 length:897 start_codon:yes stop_codon:yes gene_type:complete
MSKKKIVIIGGSGFLGSHVADYFSNQKYQVIIADKRKPEELRKNQTFYKLDLNKKINYRSLLNNSLAVFNFAAIADIENANKKPLETVETNVLSLVKLLKACIKFKVKKFILASTVYVSGNHGGFYKASKLASEVYLREFNKIHGLKYCILRYGTLYGPRSDISNGLHSLIKESLKKKKIIYSGNPNSMRDYIHVKDAARISGRVIKKEFDNKTLIISGPQSYKITDILHIISEITNIKKIKFIKKDKNKKFSHYLRTPYNIEETETFALKLSDNLNVDIGQGLTNLVYELKTKYKLK